MSFSEKLKNVLISGVECLPIVEGGKGIGLSTGVTAAAFANAGAVGTFSGVNPDVLDENGEVIPMMFRMKTRFERHMEMVEYSIRGVISQAKRARDLLREKRGRIHMNVLWEMGGTERILDESLAGAKGLIHGVVCGAGMPYRLGDIAAKHGVYYYPIVSSMRAFRALWMRSFQKTKEWLGAVVYECPWRAGGHNGLSNCEDPNVPEDNYSRVKDIRKYMNQIGLGDTPIIVGGGVWNIKEFESWLDNPEVGPVAFQFGTRPMLTKESPLSKEFREALINLKPGDVKVNHFSPTGFYSLAINNGLLGDLFARSERQLPYRTAPADGFVQKITSGKSRAEFFLMADDAAMAEKWIEAGFTEIVKTPDETIIFLTPQSLADMRVDMADCHGCLSQCRFSTWSQYQPENSYTTGKIPDFRSFCIQKSLQYAKMGIHPEKQLMFSGSEAYRFATDPMYRDGFVPTIGELVEGLMDGK